MSVTDEAVSDLRGVGQTTSKRRTGEELAHQYVRHSLWEQESLEAMNGVLFGCLDPEVAAMQQRKAVYDEERRMSEGSDSCWSDAGSDSSSVIEQKVDGGPQVQEEATAVVEVETGVEETAGVDSSCA